MSVTIRDIAAQLGISHSTVSRAFRGFPYVSEELRQRIFETARELNYRPNAAARRLKDARSGLVGLIIPDLRNDFYASAATLIQTALASEGYRVLLSVTRNDPAAERDYLRAMREERVDGLILVPCSRGDAATRGNDEESVPVVQLIRLGSDHHDAVLLDDCGAAHEATTHLLQLGHRRIGLILGESDFNSSLDRLEGYRRAVQGAGASIDQELIKIGKYDRTWGREATYALLDMAHRPSAIIAMSNELMVGVLRAFGDRQVQIPGDISIVGFGDADWCAAWRPPLTTVSYRVEDVSAAIVRILLQRIRDRFTDGCAKPVHIRIACPLVVRYSTAPRSGYDSAPARG